MSLSDIAPFRIAGNLYFVGTQKASCHVLKTSEGLLMIDTGYEDNYETILASMAELGLDVMDVKYILHSHGHYDHTDATPKMVALTGAKTFLAYEDIKYLKGFTPDVCFTDGMTVRLGDTEVLCLHTPGHTEGTYSFFFYVEENGKRWRCGSFGGAGTPQLKRDFMNKYDVPYAMRRHFLSSIDRLRGEHVDLFVGNHAGQNRTAENRVLLMADPSFNPFVDESGGIWLQFLDTLPRKLFTRLEEDSRENFTVYAHRGASEYAPENTMMAFYLGLYMGANGIETDVRKTKDGILVLHHDITPARTCGEENDTPVAEMTWAELQALQVQKNGLSDKIVTLEDFLAHFAHRDITFAIELKQADIEADVAEMLRRFDLHKKAFVTSFHFDYIANFKKLAPEFRVGWLVKEVDETVLSSLSAIGADELCPHADLVTPERTHAWHAKGFNVRAWGITHDNMRAVYDAHADGCTANFPDELLAYIKEKLSRNA